MNPSQKNLFIFFIVLSVFFVGASAYGYVEIKSLSKQIAVTNSNITALNSNLASTTETLLATIDQNHIALSSALSAEQQNVGNIQQQIQSQVGNLSGTVTTLQKLSQT